MPIIIITGTPGTGKSTIAKKLAGKLGYELIDIKKITKGNVIDVKKLQKALLARIKRLGAHGSMHNAIVEGHLACEVSLPARYVFVLRSSPRVLAKRLALRGYGRKKVDENLLAEMLDYCTQRTAKNYKVKPIEIDTSKRNVAQSVAAIVLVIKGKRKKIDDVSFKQELMEYAGARNAGRKK